MSMKTWTKNNYYGNTKNC